MALVVHHNAERVAEGGGRLVEGDPARCGTRPDTTSNPSTAGAGAR